MVARILNLKLGLPGWEIITLKGELEQRWRMKSAQENERGKECPRMLPLRELKELVKEVWEGDRRKAKEEKNNFRMVVKNIKGSREIKGREDLAKVTGLNNITGDSQEAHVNRMVSSEVLGDNGFKE